MIGSPYQSTGAVSGYQGKAQRSPVNGAETCRWRAARTNGLRAVGTRGHYWVAVTPPHWSGPIHLNMFICSDDFKILKVTWLYLKRDPWWDPADFSTLNILQTSCWCRRCRVIRISFTCCHTWPLPPVITLQLTWPETGRPRQTLGAYEKVGEQSDNDRV